MTPIRGMLCIYIETCIGSSLQLGGSQGKVLSDLLVQILANARSQLLETIQQNLARASSEGDHQAVLRFVRLYGPLGAQVNLQSHKMGITPRVATQLLQG